MNTKHSTKYLTAVFALVAVLAFSGCINTLPPPAQDPTCAELLMNEAGNATWELFPHNGAYSVLLTIPPGYSPNDWALVRIPFSSPTLAELTDWKISYWYNAQSPATASMYLGYVKEEAPVAPNDGPSGGGYAAYNTYGAPYMEIDLDADHDGSVDVHVTQIKFATKTPNVWTEDVIDSKELFHVWNEFGFVVAPSYSIGLDWGTLTEIDGAIITLPSGNWALGQADVIAVNLKIGSWGDPSNPMGPVVSYVDDVSMLGWQYYLEYPGLIILNVPA